MRNRIGVAVFAMLAGAGSAATLHWSGVGGSGVGSFGVAANWQEGAVPSTNDFVVVKNFAANEVHWAVTFDSDVTNWKAELVAATNMSGGLTFNLSGHSWTLTDSTQGIHMYEGRGGMLTFSNGTIRTPYLSFVTPPAGGTTNLQVSLKDIAAEVGSNKYAAVLATLEGGNLKVTNDLTIGVAGYGPASLRLENGAALDLANSLNIGDAVGATGELVNVSGQLEYRGSNQFYVGRSGFGALTLLGGSTIIQQIPSFGALGIGVAVLTVAGGTNTLGSGGENKIEGGTLGRATILGYGGKNTAVGLNLGSGAGGTGEMILTNGSWTFSNYSWIGCFGKGVVTMSGGTMFSPSVFCIGRQSGGTGVVTVAGGTLEVAGEVRLGGEATSVGVLTLAGSGVVKANYISEYKAGANSYLVFDGGTLQARLSGALIRSVDDIRLTTNGLALDTAGFAVTVTGLLQNALGQDGSLTKRGAGTLTLASDHTATGPVTVLGGTLKPDTDKSITLSGGVSVAGGAVLDVSVASAADYTTASGSVSKIDGSLALKAGGRLIVGAGAALAGTGSVARVTLKDGAVFARAKADNAASPLAVSDCLAEGSLTVALTGYTVGELSAALPLIRMPTAAIDAGHVAVTLNGQPSPFLKAKYVADGGQQVLSVAYSYGTLILVN